MSPNVPVLLGIYCCESQWSSIVHTVHAGEGEVAVLHRLLHGKMIQTLNHFVSELKRKWWFWLIYAVPKIVCQREREHEFQQ
jgi:hypothetical protein